MRNLLLAFDMYGSQKEGEDFAKFLAFSEYMNFTHLYLKIVFNPLCCSTLSPVRKTALGNVFFSSITRPANANWVFFPLTKVAK